MEARIYQWILIFSFSVSCTLAQEATEEDIFEITGAALLNDKRVSDYAVSVYLDGNKIDSIYAKSKRTLKFYLASNKVYTFLYQKEGCSDKIIIVNTTVPTGLKTLADNTFDFSVELSKALIINSEELEDFPVAVLLIDKDEEMLQASAEYNKLTHKESENPQSNGSGK